MYQMSCCTSHLLYVVYSQFLGPKWEPTIPLCYVLAMLNKSLNCSVLPVPPEDRLAHESWEDSTKATLVTEDSSVNANMSAVFLTSSFGLHIDVIPRMSAVTYSVEHAWNGKNPT